MNRLLTHIAALFLLAWACRLARGQTLIDLKTQSKSVDFTSAASTKPFKSGGSLPVSCGIGEAFFNTGAPAGRNFYTCTSANTWTLQSANSLPDPTGNIDGVLSNDGTIVGWRPIGGDVTGAPQNLRVGALQGRAVASTVPGDGQVLRWNNSAQDWEPGTVSSSGGGGGSAGISNFAKSFSSANTVSITGSQHGLGTSNIIVACYDNTVVPMIRVEPDLVTINQTSYDVVIKFSQPQSGVCVVNGSGGSSPLPVAGDISGTTTAATVTALQHFPVSSVAPNDGQVLTWNAFDQQWEAALSQGGSGGGSGNSTINAFSVLFQSATQLIIGAGCTVLLPCNARFGSTVYSFTNSATVTALGGSGTIYMYLASNGLITASSSNVGLSCSSGCVTQTSDGFPPSTIPLATWTSNNSVLSPTGGHDNRAFLSSKALASGLGIVVLDSGTQSTISVDAGLIPTYLTAVANLTFSQIANGACSPELTIGLNGASIGDSVAPGWPGSLPQGVLGMMRVSAASVVAVRMCNLSGAAVTPQADNFRATVVRSL
jgi:hypothetical protein